MPDTFSPTSLEEKLRRASLPPQPRPEFVANLRKVR